MREFGAAIYIRTCDDLITRELIEEAAPLVQASFDEWRAKTPELRNASYRLVYGHPEEKGNYWYHPFGWYARINGRFVDHSEPGTTNNG